MTHAKAVPVNARVAMISSGDSSTIHDAIAAA